MSIEERQSAIQSPMGQIVTPIYNFFRLVQDPKSKKGPIKRLHVKIRKDKI